MSLVSFVKCVMSSGHYLSPLFADFVISTCSFVGAFDTPVCVCVCVCVCVFANADVMNYKCELFSHDQFHANSFDIKPVCKF